MFLKNFDGDRMIKTLDLRIGNFAPPMFSTKSSIELWKPYTEPWEPYIKGGDSNAEKESDPGVSVAGDAQGAARTKEVRKVGGWDAHNIVEVE